MEASGCTPWKCTIFTCQSCFNKAEMSPVWVVDLPLFLCNTRLYPPFPWSVYSLKKNSNISSATGLLRSHLIKRFYTSLEPKSLSQMKWFLSNRSGDGGGGGGNSLGQKYLGLAIKAELRILISSLQWDTWVLHGQLVVVLFRYSSTILNEFSPLAFPPFPF